jgi:hypothetical protein
MPSVNKRQHFSANRKWNVNEMSDAVEKALPEKKLRGRTSYDTFSFFLDSLILAIPDLHKIDPVDVVNL